MPAPTASSLAVTRPDRITGDERMWMSGTSFAAPVVAGAASELSASTRTGAGRREGRADVHGTARGRRVGRRRCWEDRRVQRSAAGFAAEPERQPLRVRDARSGHERAELRAFRLDEDRCERPELVVGQLVGRELVRRQLVGGELVGAPTGPAPTGRATRGAPEAGKATSRARATARTQPTPTSPTSSSRLKCCALRAKVDRRRAFGARA
jgi:hypothetical protein